jgi:hypothetical protein
MQIHNKVANDLYGVLAKKFNKLTIADSQAVTTVESSEGRIFTLEYGGSAKSYGSVTVNIVDPSSLVIYYNNNITEDMRYDDKKDWYSFLKELRFFAKRNLMSFDVRNIGKQQLDKTDYAYIKANDNSYDSSEVTFESKLTGTLKTSYQSFGENVRLIIKHKNPVDETIRGARSRQIHSLFIENGEHGRFKLPFKSLIAGRAIAQHMTSEGAYDDEIGQHIHELTQEAYDLQRFVKAFKRADNFANIEEATKIIEQARERYKGIRETLKTISRPKGYQSYVEQYRPTEDNVEQADLEDIRSKLVRIQKDNIVDTILPNLARGINKMKVQESNKELAHNLAKDPSAKIELRPHPEEDADIKNYIDHIKQMVIRNQKTSENPQDGIVRKIIMSLAKRTVDDALSLQISDLGSMDNPADKKAAYQLASKYLKGNVTEIPTKRDLKAKSMEDQYEDYMENLSEGTWAIPDTEEAVGELEGLMADVLPLGAEGDNATSSIYGIIGDDELFDALGDAGDKNPEGDARPIICAWVKENLDGYDIPEDLKGKVHAICQKVTGATNEGAVKRAMEDDAESMSKEQFMKKHGGPNADDEGASEFYDNYNGVDEADVPEGNEFTDARKKAIDDGKDEFEVDGKKYKVTGDTSDEKKQSEGYAMAGANEHSQDEVDEIADAIKWRVTASPVTLDNILKHTDMQTLLATIEDVAEFHAPMEELGSSDISAMVKQVMQQLGMKEEYTFKGETVEEAQSPAQKAAFQKMLDAKKGKKKDDSKEEEKEDVKEEDAYDGTPEEVKKLKAKEKAEKEAEDKKKNESTESTESTDIVETPADQHLVDEILFLAGLK